MFVSELDLLTLPAAKVKSSLLFDLVVSSSSGSVSIRSDDALFSVCLGVGNGVSSAAASISPLTWLMLPEFGLF